MQIVPSVSVHSIMAKQVFIHMFRELIAANHSTVRVMKNIRRSESGTSSLEGTENLVDTDTVWIGLESIKISSILVTQHVAKDSQ